MHCGKAVQRPPMGRRRRQRDRRRETSGLSFLGGRNDVLGRIVPQRLERPAVEQVRHGVGVGRIDAEQTLGPAEIPWHQRAGVRLAANP